MPSSRCPSLINKMNGRPTVSNSRSHAWRRQIARFGLLAAACIVLTAVTGGMRAPALSLPGDDFRVTTVFLVRHAEKAAEPKDDPPLLESGVARSKALARILGDAGIRAVYTSQYLRTKQTAAPIAAKLGIVSATVNLATNPMKQGEVSKASYDELTGMIHRRAGENALIVGHSNTVPETIRALGADTLLTIRPEDFDDLFVVTIYAEGKAKVAHLKY